MPVQETVATSTKNVDRKFSCGVKKQTFLQSCVLVYFILQETITDHAKVLVK